ncbi:fibronectin type III domain-containing protein [Paenibacillus cymbidii]|uniref:fibronectin type III domain-containing protein n=1 Tax=Paenibacillus cymbidii TaxID=1639034 RepID=UPI001081D20B|nr:fibronectin type III domain-containing protein [Paenibacillus cymbidii]
MMKKHLSMAMAFLLATVTLFGGLFVANRSASAATLSFGAAEDFYMDGGVKQEDGLLKVRQLKASGGSEVDSNTIVSYLRFNVTGVTGTVTAANLKLFVENSGDPAFRVYGATGSSLSPLPTGTLLYSETSPYPTYGYHTWATFDLSSLITGNGSYVVVIKGTNGVSDVHFHSSDSTTSTWRPTLEVTTSGTDTTPPGTVTGLSAGATTSSAVALSWTAPSDNIGVTGYEVVYRTDSTAITSGNWSSATLASPQPTGTPKPAGQTESFTVSNLSSNTTYRFSVRAKDAAGNLSTTAATNVTATTTGTNTAPSQITGFTKGAVTNTTVAFTWTAPTNPGLPTDHYEIRYRTDGNNVTDANWSSSTAASPQPSGTSTSFTVSNLTANTTYKFAIRAYDSDGLYSPASANQTATTTNTTPPPSGCTVNIANTVSQVFGGSGTNTSTKVYLNLSKNGGEVVCIDPGTRGKLEFKGIQGKAGSPVIIKNGAGTNGNGVVTINNNDAGYAIHVTSDDTTGDASKYFRLTGTGSTANYGFNIANHYLNAGVTGSALVIRGGSTNYEVDHIEVSSTKGTNPDHSGDSWAGFLLKSDPSCDMTYNYGNFTQYDTLLHDNYIHDTGAEGIYLGFNNYNGTMKDCDNDASHVAETRVYPHPLIGVRVYNNITENTGYDGIQIAGAVSDVEVYNNRIVNYGVRGTSSQNNGLQINSGTTGRFYNNLIQNNLSSSVNVGSAISNLGRGDEYFYNNILIRPGDDGIYSRDDRDNKNPADTYYDDSPIHFANNTIIYPGFDSGGVGDGIDFNNTALVGSTFRNNIVVLPTTGTHQGIHDGSNMLADSFNVVTTTISSLNFVNAAADNYHLTSSSTSAKDQGTNVSSLGITTDYDGNSRPYNSTYDIGAFEYRP